jgi:hypothetical protein
MREIRLLTVPPRTRAARRAQALQRALDLGNDSGRHAGVAGRRLQPLVSEQRLNDANVPAALEQMGREDALKSGRASNATVGPNPTRDTAAFSRSSSSVKPRRF